MKKEGRMVLKNWIRRLIIAVSSVFLYWINESFIGLSIKHPTCLIIIGYFFISLSIIDLVLCKILKID